jgi:hypothetical protein
MSGLPTKIMVHVEHTDEQGQVFEEILNIKIDPYFSMNLETDWRGAQSFFDLLPHSPQTQIPINTLQLSGRVEKAELSCPKSDKEQEA